MPGRMWRYGLIAMMKNQISISLVSLVLFFALSFSGIRCSGGGGGDNSAMLLALLALLGRTNTTNAPPKVNSTIPAAGSTGVDLAATLSVTFSESMDVSSLTPQGADGVCSAAPVQLSTDNFTTCKGMNALT